MERLCLRVRVKDVPKLKTKLDAMFDSTKENIESEIIRYENLEENIKLMYMSESRTQSAIVYPHRTWSVALCENDVYLLCNMQRVYQFDFLIRNGIARAKWLINIGA